MARKAHNRRAMESAQHEIAATAARLVVEEGLHFGPAKHRAVKTLGLPARVALPSNDEVEAQVREYIALFCADTQPQELRALREHALVWMDRLAEFRPYLGGAVWHGWATRLSDIDLALFCDDPKSAEIALIDQGIDYQPQSLPGVHGEPVELTYVEFELLRALAARPGRVFTRQALLESVWGGSEYREPRTIDVHIRHLREKLERDAKDPEYIFTVRGVGYRFRDAA